MINISSARFHRLKAVQILDHQYHDFFYKKIHTEIKNIYGIIQFFKKYLNSIFLTYHKSKLQQLIIS